MAPQVLKIPSPPSDVPIKVKWVNQNPQLTAVFFIDQNNGWAAGDETLLATTDGGATWVAQHLGVSGAPMLIQFLDRNLGWIPTNWGIDLLMTRDGGKNWTSVPKPPDVNFYQTQFVDAKTGWGASNDGMWKTTDGQTWEAVGVGVVKRPFFFVDAANGWAATATGNIAATTDGGNTWRIQTTDQKLPLLAMFFLDRNRGWVLHYKSVLMTADGGQHWDAANTTIETDVDSLQFLDGNIGWACGQNQLLHTSDGGRTWNVALGQDNPDIPAVTDICFLDANTGWCAMGIGTIVATEDGGKTWQTQNAVPPFNPGKAILSKDYEGKPLIPQQVYGHGYQFKKILFANKSTGWAIGTAAGGEDDDPNGVLASTQDAGKTWTTELVGDEPYDMYFSPKGTGSIYTKGYFTPTVGLFRSLVNGRGPWLSEFQFADGSTITLAWSVALRGNPRVAVKKVEFSPGTDSNFGPLPLTGLKKTAGGRSLLKFKPKALGIQPGTRLRFRVRLQDPDGTAYTHEIAKVFVHR